MQFIDWLYRRSQYIGGIQQSFGDTAYKGARAQA